LPNAVDGRIVAGFGRRIQDAIEHSRQIRVDLLVADLDNLIVKLAYVLVAERILVDL
jgi:hypothetical protein